MSNSPPAPLLELREGRLREAIRLRPENIRDYAVTKGRIFSIQYFYWKIKIKQNQTQILESEKSPL